jgi:hypothetical protein
VTAGSPTGGESGPATFDARAALVIRACAALDLVVTGCLAVPPLARALLAALAPGMPDPGGFAWLFVHLSGVLGVLWAAVRLAGPTAGLGWADAAGRAWVGARIGWAVAAGDVPRVFLLFVATEWGGTLAQASALSRARRRGLQAGARR